MKRWASLVLCTPAWSWFLSSFVAGSSIRSPAASQGGFGSDDSTTDSFRHSMLRVGYLPADRHAPLRGDLLCSAGSSQLHHSQTSE